MGLWRAKEELGVRSKQICCIFVQDLGPVVWYFVILVWGPCRSWDHSMGLILASHYEHDISDHLSPSPICLSLSYFKALLSQSLAQFSLFAGFPFHRFSLCKVTHYCNVFREQHLCVRGKWTHLITCQQSGLVRLVLSFLWCPAHWYTVEGNPLIQYRSIKHDSILFFPCATYPKVSIRCTMCLERGWSGCFKDLDWLWLGWVINLHPTKSVGASMGDVLLIETLGQWTALTVRCLSKPIIDHASLWWFNTNEMKQLKTLA